MNLRLKKNDPLDLLEAVLVRWNGIDGVETFSFKLVMLLETSQLVGKLGNSVSYGHIWMH